jgi:stearoyl-CoA desaturase (Delta-9 desaturase)
MDWSKLDYRFCVSRIICNSHVTYKTSRWFQFILAAIGATAAQKGPIWWASHHRHHHKHSDTAEDVHPPLIYGIWYAHVGWILSNEFMRPRLELVRDLMKFPEIVWLDRNSYMPPALLFVAVAMLGWYLEMYHPELHTTMWQMVVWGFCISTTLLYHGTFMINSWAHIIGTRRFETSDESRNSWFLAIITLGEGWHNNHHRYPGSEPQGFYWWEIDISHYTLRVLEKLGLVWDIRTPPAKIYEEAKSGRNKGMSLPS